MRGAAVLALLDRAVAATASVLAAAGVLCVIAMMLVVTNEVGSRYLLNAPSTWSDETASYLLIAIVFLGLAQTLVSYRGGSLIPGLGGNRPVVAAQEGGWIDPAGVPRE